MISVLIPTLNEEPDLLACMASVAWSDDIHVYDSGSTDGTVEIARANRATVTRSPFSNDRGLFGSNEAQHKNWALANIPFKYQWVFHVDADERCSPELADSIQRAIGSAPVEVAFGVRRRDFLDGRWLKHVQATARYIRIFRPKNLRFERLINPMTVVDGEMGQLTGYLNHYPFSKGMSSWFAKHNAYSTLEAEQSVRNAWRHERFSLRKAVGAREIAVRRFHQKLVFYRMPARPLIKFLILYFLKRGFLDGRPGLKYAVLQSIYEYWIVLKTREVEGRLGHELRIPTGIGKAADV